MLPLQRLQQPALLGLLAQSLALLKLLLQQALQETQPLQLLGALLISLRCALYRARALLQRALSLRQVCLTQTKRFRSR
jgi:hypothetical protein